MAAVIETVGLRKVYKIGTEKVVALDKIDLAIDKGQVCCILGTSGSGKSTLLNQLAGLEKPTRGEVFVKGTRISTMSEKQLAHFRQRNIGFVFQSYNLLQGMSAVDNVAIPLTFRGMAKRKRMRLAREMLKAVGLGKRMDHKPSEMSGGQQQRVGIARAFVAKPDVVFADEPTGNLDTRTTREVMNLFLGFAREKQITIVLVTHDQGLALYADRIVTVVDGNVISDKENHSLYDVTRELQQRLTELGEAGSWAEAGREILTAAREYTMGVAVQALEDSVKDRENQREWLDSIAATVEGSDDQLLFARIEVDTGLVDKESVGLGETDGGPAKLPKSDAQTIEIVDGSADTLNGGTAETLHEDTGETLNEETAETLNGGTADTLNGGTADTLNGGTAETLNEETAETLHEDTGETLHDGTADTSEGGTAETLNGGTADTLNGGTAETLNDGTAETLNEDTGETLNEDTGETLNEDTGDTLNDGTADTPPDTDDPAADDDEVIEILEETAEIPAEATEER